MVRHRIPSSTSSNEGRQDKDPRGLHKKNKKGSRNKLVFFATWCGIAGLVILIGYVAHRGYLESRVYTPLNLPRAVQKTEDASLYWGSYRPGVYFGLKTRSPANLLFGLMWMIPDRIKPNDLGLRHWCEQGDNLDSFGWLQHNGQDFGVQEIHDRGLNITTSYIKEEDDKWSARVTVHSNSKKPRQVTLFFYAGMDENASGYTLRPILSDSEMTGIIGNTNGLGDFQLHFSSDAHDQQSFYSLMDTAGPHKFTESVMQRLKLFQMGNSRVIGLDAEHLRSSDPNLVVYQVNAQIPFEIDVSFSAQKHPRVDDLVMGQAYTSKISEKRREFETQFEATFGLKELGYDRKYIQFAQAAMSNMIGGIGYFYGHSLVQSHYQSTPVRYWDGPLFTAVPSRSFFPRGFLWDEGFHNLLISKWNKRLSSDIIAHWLDMMNVEGWIPREQILGKEARAKVPAEFVVQKNTNANPPTLLLTLHSMVTDFKNEKKIPFWFEDYLTRIWPRLEVWYNWFNETQAGPVDATFRWRGRNASAIYELNPKTLTSGLDDYPRASHPTDDERHIDLRCWMALASRLMADIGAIIGQKADKYQRSAVLLHNNQLLDQLHWSEDHGAYLDYGLHSEDVVLQRPRPPPGQHQQMQKQRVVHETPQMQFVNQVGYVSLFPFLLQIVDPTSPKLGKILKDLRNPAKFWTPYGLRSLSKTASIYMKKNTEHDAPYWRGPIWININYLAVRALYHYAQLEGPYQKEAQEAYVKLREALITNIYSQYEKTGYVWEQYNDRTGQGQGCRPFTGWSSLVVLMMGEKY